MSVVAVVSAFQSLHRTIEGVKSAPDDLPASLSAVSLPCVLTVPRAASWALQAIGLPRQTRTYDVMVYVGPVALGRTIDENFSHCLPLLQRFGESYLNNQTLSGAVERISEISDGGVESLGFAGTSYWGFTYHVAVVEK